MADVQKQFVKFHDEIRHRDGDEKAKLQEKRDLLVDDLKKGLKKQAEEKGEDPLKFTSFNQGSYAMHTGTKPHDNDYDIDVGIVFDNIKDDFDGPVALKKKVRDALDSQFRTVNIRRPCVTVTYMKDKKPDYHVDMAIYAKIDNDDIYDIAMGKEHSSEENCVWDNSDPKGLIKEINERFDDEEERKQYRRVIRYLKRWRDRQFKNGGAPISIGLTCAAYHWFEPIKVAGSYNDLRAVRHLVNKMISEFTILWSRLEVKLPVTPKSDLFEKMTEKQMGDFKEKLTNLRESLDKAKDDESLKSACKTLNKEFGDDFPIPEDDNGGSDKSGTKKSHSKKPYVTTGTSA